jgi:hypothetical protein
MGILKLMEKIKQQHKTTKPQGNGISGESLDENLHTTTEGGLLLDVVVVQEVVAFI